MKKYIFTVKRAMKSVVEIEAENKNDAFKKLVNLVSDNEEKILKKDIEKQIYRFKLDEIIEKNGKGFDVRYPYLRDEDTVKIIEELDEDEGCFRKI